MFFVNNEPLHRAINTTGIAAWSNAENHRALAESPAGGDKSPSSKLMVREAPGHNNHFKQTALYELTEKPLHEFDSAEISRAL